MVRFRRAHEAHRDARLVFRAAAEGRPLELQRRLVLGKLACDILKTSLYLHTGQRMTAIEAALMGGHVQCVRLL